MFSLQIQIRKLINRKQNDDHPNKLQSITIRFGSIQTDLELINGTGGKKLLLQMEIQQMQNMLRTYAFGLFFKNQNGKYFSILSLQRLQINGSFNNHQIYFFNDDRNICFQSSICINLNLYQPKIAKKVAQKKVSHQIQQKTKISSFLYGNKKNQNQQQKVNLIKPPIAPQRQKIQQNKILPTKNIQESSIPKNKIRPSSTIDQDDNDGLFIPPVMQFTNQVQQKKPINIPQIQMIHKMSQEQKKFTRKQNNFVQVNQVKNTIKQKQFNTQKKKNKPSISRQQIREQAKRQAQNQTKNQQNVMIPIPKGNTYELVPLSKLSQTQIVQYAHQQKRIQQQKRKQKQLKKQLQQAKMKEMKKAPQLPQRKKSNQPKRQSKPNIIEEQSQQDIDDDIDYQSDFDSISVGNSVIKSRHSLRSSNYLSSNKKVDESQNIFQSGYSQDFDSYSHSMHSHKKRANSISQISESMISISQSYKK